MTHRSCAYITLQVPKRWKTQSQKLAIKVRHQKIRNTKHVRILIDIITR